MASHPVLVIFCKRPLPGQGKQRIAATLGKKAAFAIATDLLQCALEDALEWPGTVVLSPGSEADRQWALDLQVKDTIVVPQCEGNLGEKLNYVDRNLRQQGFEKLLFIGTDAPEHTASLYQSQIDLFEQGDMVFTPADDGGVTAMGCKQAWPDLSQLPWSTEGLGQALVDCCMAKGFQVAFSSACYDADNQADLERLKKTLAQDTRPARQQLLKTITEYLPD